jgi:lysophospholipase L1-like esterase
LRALSFIFIISVALAAMTAAQDGAHWVATWSAAATARVDQLPASSAPAPATHELVLPPAVKAVAPNQELAVAGQSLLHFNNQTLRQIVHLTIGGSRLRVVLANTFGTAPLPVGAAQVALRDRDASIVPASSRALTFGGIAHTTVPAGAILVSDPVDLVVADDADLAIDLYLPGDTVAMKSPITIHPAAWQTNYVSPAGNHAGVVAMPVETTTAYRRSDGLVTASWFFLARVEVLAARETGAIVAIGDSITDGTGSTIDTNNRWPNHLARRLAEAGVRMAVLNAGIGGNRVLAEGNGPSALARFDRDVITQPGVTHAIVLEGINDIGQARQQPSPTALDLIAGHRQMIERAHAHGIRIYGATLVPFEGAASWTVEGEAKRQALNEWIRTGHAYDAVFDFDAAVRDPDHPARMRSQYDSGDHIHLNAAGYQAMARAVDIAVFRGR